MKSMAIFLFVSLFFPLILTSCGSEPPGELSSELQIPDDPENYVIKDAIEAVSQRPVTKIAERLSLGSSFFLNKPYFIGHPLNDKDFLFRDDTFNCVTLVVPT